MKSVLLFGSTGNVGKQIAKETLRKGYNLTAVVRSSQKANEISEITKNILVADVTKPAELRGICNGFDIVISALGKSVSPNDKSKASFYEVDFAANASILKEAVAGAVGKFVYVSALQSERFTDLEYFKVHHEFSEKLKRSGLDYSIIKPPSIFSAYLDVVDMARKGRLAHLGKGDKRTNPIYEGDLAVVCINAIDSPKSEIEAGGREILTRKQINEIIQHHVNPSRKIPTIPTWAIRAILPLIRVTNKNMFDKFAFFVDVMQHDVIAPQVGQLTLKEYLAMKV
ncbi:MAG TPA: NAD(P)H-binding protein [Chryseolinea sp.]